MWNLGFKNSARENTRTIRVRQHEDGHFEFLQPVQTHTKEFDVVVIESLPTNEAMTQPVKLSPAWSMGNVGIIAREHLYDELE